MHFHGEFFHVHASQPVLLLLGLAFFPRITLLFVGGPFNVLQWLGWFIAPHFTVALMATFMYWDSNPLLVAISWLFALCGSSGEAKTAKRAATRRAKNAAPDA